MKYPSWFPRWQSWLKALFLLFYLIPAFLSIRMIGEMAFNLLHVIPHPESRKFWTWLIFTLTVPPVGTIAFIHHWFFGKEGLQSPKWLPRWTSLGQGAVSWFIGFTALAITFICFYLPNMASAERTSPFIQNEPNTAAPFFYPIWESLPDHARSTDSRNGIGALLFIITAAYFYHLQQWAIYRLTPKIPKQQPPHRN